MGKLSDMFQDYARAWAENDTEKTLGIPRQGTGPGHGTGHGGTGGAPGTGSGGPPQYLTEEQRTKLEQFFHNEYGRYPASDYEFQRWLKHNW